MFRLSVLSLLVLAGCAHAPSSELVDPIACAFAIAHTLPASGERRMVLSDIAISASSCDRAAPGKYWAHVAGASYRSRAALKRAYAYRIAGDSARTRREALRAWREDELERIPDPQDDLRGSVTSLLLDVGAYEDLLDLLDRHPNMRLSWFDADGARAEIAGLAAVDGNAGAVARAIGACTTPVARATARCEAARGSAVARARAGEWDGALALAHAAACRPACGIGLDFALARAAQGELADSLIARLLERAQRGEQFNACGGLKRTASPLEVVTFLARSGRVAEAESLLVLEDWIAGFEGHGWTELAIALRERGELEAASQALDRGFAENFKEGVEAWSAAWVYTAMAETLLAAGWPDAARAALDRGIAAARAEKGQMYRVMALASAVTCDGVVTHAEAGDLVREALEVVIAIEDPGTQARALGRLGAAARTAKVTIDAEERRWLAEMASARPPWRATLSE